MSSRIKGRAVATEFVAAELAAYAANLPVGARVRHSAGRTGTVRMDNPANVPGIHTGTPTAWCLLDEAGTGARVCVSWDNPSHLTWLVWVPVDTVTLADVDRSNRPALAVASRS